MVKTFSLDYVKVNAERLSAVCGPGHLQSVTSIYFVKSSGDLSGGRYRRRCDSRDSIRDMDMLELIPSSRSSIPIPWCKVPFPPHGKGRNFSFLR